jgi:hypothetical protein
MQLTGVAREQLAAGPLKKTDLASTYAHQGEVTTVMLKNVPRTYTQEELLEELVTRLGTSDIFDFFYLPWDLAADLNVGYAFVNFRDASCAAQCVKMFSQSGFRHTTKGRPCKACPAHIQGLHNNLQHFADRAVSDSHTHYPIIMWHGERLKLGRVMAALDEHLHGIQSSISLARAVPKDLLAHLAAQAQATLDAQDVPLDRRKGPDRIENVPQWLSDIGMAPRQQQPTSSNVSWPSKAPISASCPQSLAPDVLTSFSPDFFASQCIAADVASRPTEPSNAFGGGRLPLTFSLRPPDEDILRNFLKKFGA